MDSESNMFFIFNIFGTEFRLFILCRLVAKPYAFVRTDNSCIISYAIVDRNDLTKQIIYIC